MLKVIRLTHLQPRPPLSNPQLPFFLISFVHFIQFLGIIIMPATPLTLEEVFPSYQLAEAGAITLTADSVVIALEDLPSASADELALVTGNAGEFIRAVVKQGKVAIDAREAADRPTKFNILQQNGVTSIGVNAETGLPEASHEYQVVTVYPLGGNDSAISPESVTP